MDIQDIQEALKQPEIEHLPNGVVGLLLRTAKIEVVKPGMTLMTQGAQSNIDLHLVIKGQLEVVNEENPENRVEIGPGTFLGEVSSLAKKDQKRIRSVKSEGGAELLKWSLMRLYKNGGDDWPPLEKYLQDLAQIRLDATRY